MTKPWVSVITPTWLRHDTLLRRCIPSVAAQTYPNVEHIVVCDGPDEDLFALLSAEPHPGLRYADLPVHDNGARWGHWARLAGIEMASGDYIAYLDDDNAHRPQHLELLVAALESNPKADFAYSRTLMNIGSVRYEIGTDPPQYGQIDTSCIVHRREILQVETWLPSLPTIDWDLVNRWIKRGMDWVYVPEVTADYYK